MSNTGVKKQAKNHVSHSCTRQPWRMAQLWMMGLHKITKCTPTSPHHDCRQQATLAGKPDYGLVRQAIAEAMEAPTTYDDGSYGPLLVRACAASAAAQPCMRTTSCAACMRRHGRALCAWRALPTSRAPLIRRHSAATGRALVRAPLIRRRSAACPALRASFCARARVIQCSLVLTPVLRACLGAVSPSANMQKHAKT